MSSSRTPSISSAVDGFALCVQRGGAGQRRPLLISGGRDHCQELKTGRGPMWEYSFVPGMTYCAALLNV